MKRILLFLVLSVSCNVWAQQDTILPLRTHWTFRAEGSDKAFPALVPGSIYTDLYINKQIPDPFTGNNEKQLQWIGDSVWIYTCSFDVSPNCMNYEHSELVMEGLDTYAEVFVNNQLVLSADNAFRQWNQEVKPWLKPGANTVTVKFSPASKIAAEKASAWPYPLPGGERCFVRKPQFQFGWDFAPVFTGCAIWKPVTIKFWNLWRIEDSFVRQLHVDSNKAELCLELTVLSDQDAQVNMLLTEHENQYLNVPLELKKGVHVYRFNFLVANPRLWWCNGMGKQELYSFIVTLSSSAKKETQKKVVGLRNMEWVQQPDVTGKSFYLKLNGVPVFAKGSNWVPLSVFPGTVSDKRYELFVNEAVSCNMNMLRVWGGGLYESDMFYELCDRKGIMVWQDFMYACSTYPTDSLFVKNVQTEITQQVKRLRNHACLTLWCGNNEVSEGWHNWNWQHDLKYSSADSISAWNGYQALFEKIIPAVVSQYDSAGFYWPSSPSIGWGRKESLLSGDCHYWGVWWGMEPFSVYKSKTGRFMSEYGFQGLPEWSALQRMSGEFKPAKNDSLIRNHQKHPTGFETIDRYMGDEFRRPHDFNEYVYMSRLLQAYGISTAIQAHRRTRPLCMGTLYWQLNDCWPGISWSSVDFYGKKKALAFMVKKDFQEELLSVDESPDSLWVYAISDKSGTFSDSAFLSLEKFNGESLWNKKIAVNMEAGSRIVFRISKKKLLKEGNIHELVFTSTWKSSPANEIRTSYFDTTKKLALIPVEIQTRLLDGSKGSVFKIKSNYLIKNIELKYKGDVIQSSDNYFDVLPGREYYIDLNMKLSEQDLKNISFNYLTNE